MRYYSENNLSNIHIKALKAIQKTIDLGKKDMLIQMSIGTGKTNLVMKITEEFLVSKKAKRILYLTKLRNIQYQSYNRFFEYFSNTSYNTSLFQIDNQWRDSNIIISTYQKIIHHDIKLESEFDLIIFDEADITLQINFKSFNGYKISFVQSNLSSLSNNKPIFKYTLQDAVSDGSMYNLKSGLSSNIESEVYKETSKTIKIIKSYLSEGKDIPLNSLKEIASMLDDINDSIKENGDILKNIAEKKVSKNEIFALVNKKEQLSEFITKLNKPKNILEREWQEFFELNTWIFGYGLNYIFNSSLNNKKLEQFIGGHDFNTKGKKIDALMKSRGLINSLCFVEIKTPSTKLLDKQYRNESWSISSELAGSIAQIHKYKYKALRDVKDRIEIKSKEGEKTGEIIYNYNPRLVLVIGHLEEFKNEYGVNEDKLSSFEMFRKSIEGIDIITFDELYNRAKHIIE